jgi:NAD(P)-dependent dehydrogenase (short-subunit alcohol dehydrogenase family)
MDLGIRDKVAIVTGASSGIGAEACRSLAREGVNLVLCARRKDRILELAQGLTNEFHVSTLPLEVDLTDPAAADLIVANAEHAFRGADFLISNAGTGSNETILSSTDEQWQNYWNLHVMATVRLARRLVPLMHRRGGGVILTNGSLCGKQPFPTNPIFSVTKAALMMLTKCLANEVARLNVRVNCVNPGPVFVEHWQAMFQQQAAAHNVSWQDYARAVGQRDVPIGRFGTPEELADFMTFLCSPRAGFCHGATYYVDGGALACIA